MGNIGFPELVVIVVVALLVFGPDRLPELARNLGDAVARFRRETNRSVGELKKAADIGDLDRELRGLSRDLRDVRSSVTKALMSESPPPTPPARAEDAPPPLDDEAT